MNKKFICLGLFLLIPFLGGCSSSIPGGGGESSPSYDHEHTFSDDWTYDETYHWHASTCGHTEEISGKERHTFTEEDIEPTHVYQGYKLHKCTVCDYSYKTDYIDKLKYMVLWKNFNGDLLETDYVYEGETPSFDGEEPTKESDSLHSYEFDGWSKKVGPIYEDTVFIATFKEVELKPTLEKLSFTLSSSGSFYSVSAANKEISGMVVIPNIYNNLPVNETKSEGFKACKNITSVIFKDNGVEKLSYWSFGNCDNLQSIILPNSLTLIDSSAIFKCQALKSIVIPDNVTMIEENAFASCTALETIALGNSKAKFAQTSLSDCSSLTAFTTASTNEKYKAVDGVLYSFELSELILFPRGRTGTYTLLNKVTRIKTDAFYYCSLESFVCPNDGKLYKIEEGAFDFCLSLTSLNMCESIKTLEDYCIFQCMNLTYLSFDGTIEQWNQVSKTNKWHYGLAAPEIECSNGKVAI